ncbi:MAG TPA: threonine/serine dehydratase [Longimicrobiales bacterium]
MLTLSDIREARSAIADRIHRTPLLSSAALGARTGLTCFIKAESLQKTGAFKVRGALNKVRRLTAEEKARGLVTVSAGNHAQGVAYAAAAAGAACTVVMPEGASRSKVAASEGYGARVVLHGTVTDAFARCEELRREHGYTFVHPFDDPDIMAGQGTIGLEIVEDLPDVDAVIAPVGGGGLLSGTAAALKAVRPEVRIFGVEPTGAAGLHAALRAGGVVRLERIDTVADGLTAPQTGEHVLEHVRALVDDVVLVEDAEIIEALRFLLERTKLMVEPAGAAAVAALLAGKIRLPSGARVVAIASGGNVDLARLRELLPG